MKELKKRFRSLYWQQFSLIAGILLLTLLLLGASFYALSYNYLVREKREEMQSRAQVIAQMTADYLAASEADQEVDSSLSRMAGVASMMTEVNFLICDENGQALLTTDDTLAGRSIRLPGEITDKILNSVDGFEGYTTLSGLYKLRQFAVGLPVKTSGLPVNRIRFLTVLVAGCIGGLAGSFYTVGYLGMFSSNIIGGRGWIAFAICFLGNWSPKGAVLGTLAFGLADALSIYFRTGTTAVPTELIIALPYILTIVLTIFRSNFRVPAKLGVPYRKEG